LRMHMFRVTAVAQLISDHWEEKPLDNKLLARVLLIHDLGNLAKIDPTTLSAQDFALPCTLDQFVRVRAAFMGKFGSDDHRISAAIAQELGYSANEIDFMNRKTFIRNDETLVSSDFNLKVAAYADQRVSPTGIDSLSGRLSEAKERYRDKPGSSMNNPRTDMLIRCALDIETQIMKHCTLGADQITDLRAAPIVLQLERYEL